jgi:hypothetical protein
LKNVDNGWSGSSWVEKGDVCVGVFVVLGSELVVGREVNVGISVGYEIGEISGDNVGNCVVGAIVGVVVAEGWLGFSVGKSSCNDGSEVIAELMLGGTDG